jgi:hypothetical protein
MRGVAVAAGQGRRLHGTDIKEWTLGRLPSDERDPIASWSMCRGYEAFGSFKKRRDVVAAASGNLLYGSIQQGFWAQAPRVRGSRGAVVTTSLPVRS